jgi:NAD(P)-dependent dehydrogenase (short-subunit alcohol dehydrogenase family)
VSLAGKAALVTGAGRGIGLEIARLLAARGMAVGVNDVDEQAVERVCLELCASGRLALALPGDITCKAQVACLFERIEAELGPIWLLVNNAGVYHSAPAEELSEEAWDRDFAVDAKGTFLCSQAAIRRMIPRRGGRIVNVASIAGLIVRTRQLSYCAAKAAVIHFSRCLAVEVAPHGITVNCLCPGMTRTEMLMQSARDRGMRLEDYEAAIPAGHMAAPEDHARLVTYLASEDAAHITGQVISVDGGQSLNLPLTITRSQ